MSRVAAFVLTSATVVLFSCGDTLAQVAEAAMPDSE